MFSITREDYRLNMLMRDDGKNVEKGASKITQRRIESEWVGRPNGMASGVWVMTRRRPI